LTFVKDLANEFNLQIILAGGTPQDNLEIEKPILVAKTAGK